MFFDKLFKRAAPRINEEQAIEIARHTCEQRGWSWQEPIRVISKRSAWLVRTNWESRGASARVEIDKHSGDVIHAGYIPR